MMIFNVHEKCVALFESVFMARLELPIVGEGDLAKNNNNEMVPVFGFIDSMYDHAARCAC